jgi:transposase
MLSLPPSVRIVLCVRPADMRWRFDRLAAMVNEVLRQDPLSGHLFVFRNRPGDRIKLLYWDTDGYAIWYKRLEEGTFRFPGDLADGAEIDAATLAMVLKGIDLSRVKRHRRYARPPVGQARSEIGGSCVENRRCAG